MAALFLCIDDEVNEFMSRVATSWKVIEAVLKEHVHSAYRALRPAARPGQIERLEGVLGTRLPPAFVASLGIHDGMRGVNSAGPNFVNYMIPPITSYWSSTVLAL